MARLNSASVPAKNAPPDQRGAQRFTLLLRAAKLIVPAGEFLCLLRDVSDGGVKLRLFHPLELQGESAIELASGERYRVMPVWQDGMVAGLRFVDAPLAVARVLEEAGPFPKRTIRLQLRAPHRVQLSDGAVVQPAAVCDLSQHGAAITCPERLPIGAALALESAVLGSIPAHVRWRRGERYGLVFAQSFRLDLLAQLAARLQNAESGAVDAEILAPLTTD